MARETVRQWFMVSYSNETFGLMKGDGVMRGIPEGARAEWLELIAAMRKGEDVYSKRLAYTPWRGIYSPRNTNFDHEAFHTTDADLILYLLDHPVAWREDNLTNERPAEDYLLVKSQ